MTTIGSTGPFALPPRQTRRARTGVVIEPRTKVLNSDLATFLAGLGSAEYDVDPIEGSPYSLVTVTQPETEEAEAILADLWSVSFNEEQLSLWAKPAVRAELAKADPAKAALFKADVEALLSGNRTVTDAEGNEIELTFTGLVAVAVALGMNGAVISALLTSLGQGVEYYYNSLPVIRRTITLPSTTSLHPAFANLGALYSTSALLSAEPTIPTNLSAELPSGWWLKKAPSASQNDDGRWQYEVEYWYVDSYDPFVYETVFP